MTIHWCGTGLSAIPGLRRLIREGLPVAVWNRTPERARDAVGDLTGDIRAFAPEALEEALAPGDLVVSMLPGDWHPRLAAAAIAHGAHFVSSSYVSPQMRALDGAARRAGVALVNEVGLDPGIDHLMAHDLVADYRDAPEFDPANRLSFSSYCGGIPKRPNAFRYKFSWSPLGVLKALKSPSRSLRDGRVLEAARPWEALSTYTAPLPEPERFEVYPNRDSLPFMAEYGFEEDWDVADFVRGTLRLEGWARAWETVFAEAETASEARLREMSDAFWRDHAYGEGEPDRVVLFVSLKAARDGATLWHRSWALDAWGDGRGSAMARLVSVPVSLAVRAVLAGEIGPGVSAAPSERKLVDRWLAETGRLAQYMEKIDRLA